MGYKRHFMFDVYGKDRRLIFTGTNKQTRKFLELDKSITRYVTGKQKTIGDYVVVKRLCGDNPKDLLPPKPKKETLYEQTKRLILQNNNTNMVVDPTEIVERLKADGINCDIIQYSKRSWVLERVQ